MTRFLITNLSYSFYLLNCVVYSDSTEEIITKKLIYIIRPTLGIIGDKNSLCLETRIPERHTNAQMSEQLLQIEDFGEPFLKRINSEYKRKLP